MMGLKPAIRSAMRSPAARFALALWLGAGSILVLDGNLAYAGLVAAKTVFEMFLLGITVLLTHPPAEAEATRQPRGRLLAQLAVILAVIVLTGMTGFARIPLWSGMVDWLSTLGERFLPAEVFGGPGNALANPVQYLAIPLILLLLLGAKLRELGFQRGHRAGRVSLVWSAVPVVTWIVLLGIKMIPLLTVVRRLVGNTFQNGFFEEFLMRGALQSRLNQLLPHDWALVLASVIFGLWHLYANTTMFGGSLLLGLAACLYAQMVSGIIFGVVFNRTRSLFAPSVAHVMTNSFGQTFG